MPSQGRLGDKSYAPADGHGCVACAHPVIGPAIKGSSDVFVNSLPALRVGDNGVHAACCGPNTWTAVKGSSTVFINGRPAHRMGDKDQHCGGIGDLVEGSPNVMVGDSGAGGAGSGAGAGDAELISYDPSAVSGEAISALACTQAQTLREAAKSGVPFCEKCKKIDVLSSDDPEPNCYSETGLEKFSYFAAIDANTVQEDSEKYCVDIHCHSILTPFHKINWKKLKKRSKKINLWKKSDNPGLIETQIFEWATTLAPYTKSDFKKLAKGKVKVAFVSLTPIEHGFMTMPGVTTILKDYPRYNINELISPTHNYFEYLKKEYEFLKEHQSDKGKIDGKTFQYELVKNYGVLRLGKKEKEEKGKGKEEKFIDDNYKSKSVPKDQVNIIAVVLTVEGGHTLGCGQKDTVFYKITAQSLEEISKAKLTKIYTDYLKRIAPQVVPELIELVPEEWFISGLNVKQSIKNIEYILGKILYKKDLDSPKFKVADIFELTKNLNSMELISKNNLRELIFSLFDIVLKKSVISKLDKMNLEIKEKAATFFISDLVKFIYLYERLETIKNTPKQGETNFLKLVETTIGYKLKKKDKKIIIEHSKSCDEDFEESTSKIEECKEELWETIEANINTLKNWEHSPLFITVTHHFWNQLCGHSMTVPKVKRIIHITKGMRKNQVLGMNTGFTPLGKKVVKKLLDNKNNKRILIDTKHMSIKSKKWYYYDYLGYNSDKKSFKKKIPIISSHSAVNGYKTMKDSEKDNDGKTYKAYKVADKKYRKSGTFNNWDMNLSDEEIEIIYASEGLIGINFDQRVLGGKKGGKKRINRLVNNILYIANVAKQAGFSDCWSCITIGSDFDGNINPINNFRTAKKFANLETTLKKKLKSAFKKDIIFETDSGKKSVNLKPLRRSPEDIVERIMYRNAMDFLDKNFK